MFKGLYHRRLSTDLQRWTERGWVSADSAENILADTAPRAAGERVPAIIGMLGAILLAFAAMTFVAANWDEMSKLARLSLLFAAMWAIFGAAWWLQQRGHDWLTDGALLLGAGMFGANIMLVAQIYHLDGHYPDAILLWTAGALLVTIMLGARSTLGLAFILMVIWSGSEIFDFQLKMHWSFLPVWLIATSLAVWLRWRPGFHLALVSLLMWIVFNITPLIKQTGWPEISAIAILAGVVLLIPAVAAAMEAGVFGRRLQGFEDALIRYGLLSLFGLHFIFQALVSSGLSSIVRRMTKNAAGNDGWIILCALLLAVSGVLLFLAWRQKTVKLPDISVLLASGVWAVFFTALIVYSGLTKEAFQALSTWVYGALYLGFALWAVMFGQRRHDNLLISLGLTAFGVEILYIYFRVFGTLLETSLFFFVGGIVLIGLAFFLNRLRRTLISGGSGEVRT